MKVTIVKYLNPKGKVVEMRKDKFKGSYISKSIIVEYEVEIKDGNSVETDSINDLMLKYLNGNYIIIVSCDGKKWETRIGFSFITHYKHLKLIHIKHKDILEAYLKNPSVEIETEMFAPMTGETEPSKWVKLEKDFIEDYNEEFWYRIKVKDLAWYEEKDIIGKLLKAENSQTGLNELCIFKYKGKDSITAIGLDGKEFIGFFSNFRPVTESEVLSLVYKPLQKVSKEINLIESKAESNRLKDLFLKDKAECLVENEQEVRLVYDFLDKNCDKSLRRKSAIKIREYPALILTEDKWGNIYEWNVLKDRDKNKPLIKFNGETFWEVFE